MNERVLKCISFDTSTATCTQSAWVEQTPIIPTLETAAAMDLLKAVTMLLLCAWGWKQLGRTIRS